MCFNLRHLFFIWLVKIRSVQCLDFFLLSVIFIWPSFEFEKFSKSQYIECINHYKNTNWQLRPVTPHHSPSCKAKFSRESIPRVHKTALFLNNRRRKGGQFRFSPSYLSFLCASLSICSTSLDSSPSIKGENM